MPRPMLTPREAKAKWCPLTAAALEPANCIADACMAWREDYDGTGYCGLAGNPYAALTAGVIKRDAKPGATAMTILPEGVNPKDR